MNIGNVFGRLTVLSIHGSTAVCLCTCGNTKAISKYAIAHGRTKSCGCLNTESAARRNTKHGGVQTKEYGIWRGMIQRCHNPNHSGFKHYGARGITVCDSWRKSFSTFLRDVGPRPSSVHSIDRIDNNGNYCPENVRWATPSQQSKNKRPYANNKSGCTGVMWHKRSQRWRAVAYVSGKKKHLGSYADIREAIAARESAQ